MSLRKASELTKIALCAAMLCVASYIVIPLPFTPVVLSMHTLAVNLTGLILKPKHAVCVIALYILMGLVGLPVFAGGAAGIGKLFGPTGGFYFGFLPAAAGISLLKGKNGGFWRYALVCLAAFPIQHLTAVLWMAHFGNVTMGAALWTVSVPFIPGDIAKCFLSAAMAMAIEKGLTRAR